MQQKKPTPPMATRATNPTTIPPIAAGGKPLEEELLLVLAGADVERYESVVAETWVLKPIEGSAGFERLFVAVLVVRNSV
jgi:hypothetical protein